MVGTVIDARVFSRRKGDDRDFRTQQIEEQEEAQLRRDMNSEIQILRKALLSRMRSLLVGQTTANKLIHQGQELLPKGKKINDEILSSLPQSLWSSIMLVDMDVQFQVKRTIDTFADQQQLVTEKYTRKIDRMKKGDELPPGVLKMVKIYIAIKRKLQVGDKMAGRHGNKGVVSRILPEEDMPYTADGTPVDVVLNPLGVPSRMNVGQILETHLGWAAYGLGEKMRELTD